MFACTLGEALDLYSFINNFPEGLVLIVHILEAIKSSSLALIEVRSRRYAPKQRNLLLPLSASLLFRNELGELVDDIRRMPKGAGSVSYSKSGLERPDCADMGNTILAIFLFDVINDFKSSSLTKVNVELPYLISL